MTSPVWKLGTVAFLGSYGLLKCGRCSQERENKQNKYVLLLSNEDLGFSERNAEGV